MRDGAPGRGTTARAGQGTGSLPGTQLLDPAHTHHKRSARPSSCGGTRRSTHTWPGLLQRAAGRAGWRGGCAGRGGVERASGFCWRPTDAISSPSGGGSVAVRGHTTLGRPLVCYLLSGFLGMFPMVCCLLSGKLSHRFGITHCLGERLDIVNKTTFSCAFRKGYPHKELHQDLNTQTRASQQLSLV